MPIVRAGYYINKNNKYRVWIQPSVDKLKVTDRYNVSRAVFKHLKNASVIMKEPLFSVGALKICSRYYFNIRRLEAFTQLIGPLYFPRIVSMGKITVPKNLSYMNEFEAIVGSLCDESRFRIPPKGPYSDLYNFNTN
jgi:hypothetical protein